MEDYVAFSPTFLSDISFPIPEIPLISSPNNDFIFPLSQACQKDASTREMVSTFHCHSPV